MIRFDSDLGRVVCVPAQGNKDALRIHAARFTPEVLFGRVPETKFKYTPNVFYFRGAKCRGKVYGEDTVNHLPASLVYGDNKEETERVV